MGRILRSGSRAEVEAAVRRFSKEPRGRVDVSDPPGRHALLLCLLVLAFSPAPRAAGEDSVAHWVESLGGRCFRNDENQITGVDLRSTWLSDADLKKLKQVPRLERIHLAYTKITDLGVEHLAALEHVKVLDLHYAESITDVGIAHLKHWRNLEHLNVRGTKVTSAVFQHVSKMEELRSLDVGHTRVTDDLFEELVHLGALVRFSFGGNKMSGTALPLLKLLPSLRALDVSGQQRTDSGLWSVAVTDFNIESIAELDQLEELDLGETDISDRGVARLGRLAKLRTLDLSGTRVTGRGLAALAPLPHLRHLKLWRAEGINDAAIPSLVEMAGLEVLEMPETSITEKGLMELSRKKSLRKLFLGGVDVSPNDVEALREALPDCAISWWKKPKIESRERQR